MTDALRRDWRATITVRPMTIGWEIHGRVRHGPTIVGEPGSWLTWRPTLGGALRKARRYRRKVRNLAGNEPCHVEIHVELDSRGGG